MNWDIVWSILTALGIFELAKRIINFSIDNNLIKRNLEIRGIADRVLEWSSWLKLRNFEQPLPMTVSNQLYLDIFKIEEIDKGLSEDMMRLINYPQMNRFLYEGIDRAPENRRLITENCERLHEMTNKLNKKCNKLRYYPLIDIQKILKKLIALKALSRLSFRKNT